MDRTKLAEYFFLMKDLELRCLKNELLQKQLENLLAVPKEPVVPIMPEKPYFDTSAVSTSVVVTGILFALSVLLFLLNFIIGIKYDTYYGLTMFLVLTTVVLGVVFLSRLENRRSMVKKYTDSLNTWQKCCDDALEQYKLDNVFYETALARITQFRQKYMPKLEYLGASLQASKRRMYSIDVIFPKYRNLIAVSAIYEYLSCGRCFELEGPGGAYNLYESEVKQNLIIEQLSTITNNPSVIKNTMYTLYTDLEKTKRELQLILGNSNELNKKIENYIETQSKELYQLEYKSSLETFKY